MTDMDPLARLRAVADTDEHPDARFAGELRRRLIDGLTDTAIRQEAIEIIQSMIDQVLVTPIRKPTGCVF